jgi:hypothetical protein
MKPQIDSNTGSAIVPMMYVPVVYTTSTCYPTPCPTCGKYDYSPTPSLVIPSDEEIDKSLF